MHPATHRSLPHLAARWPLSLPVRRQLALAEQTSKHRGLNTDQFHHNAGLPPRSNSVKCTLNPPPSLPIIKCALGLLPAPCSHVCSQRCAHQLRSTTSARTASSSEASRATICRQAGGQGPAGGRARWCGGNQSEQSAPWAVTCLRQPSIIAKVDLCGLRLSLRAGPAWQQRSVRPAHANATKTGPTHNDDHSGDEEAQPLEEHLRLRSHATAEVKQCRPQRWQLSHQPAPRSCAVHPLWEPSLPARHTCMEPCTGSGAVRRRGRGAVHRQGRAAVRSAGRN